MNWEIITLGEAATFVNGYAFKPTDWSTKGKEIIRIQNLTKGNAQINYFEGTINEKYKVRKGDLLISWSATLGIYQWEKEDAWLNQHIFKVVFDKKKFDIRFFKFLISSSLTKMEQQVHGATMKHITKKKFDAFKIPFPPLSEQKRIAKLLSKADKLRQLNKKLIEKYDELAQSVFLDMFGDPVINPKGWEKVNLEKLFEITSSKRIFRNEYVEKGVPFYRTKEIVELSKGKEISSELFISLERYNEIISKYDIPKKGDILLSAVGTIGIMWTVDTNTPFYFKDGNLAWLKTSKAENLNPVFLKIMLEYLINYEKEKLAQGGSYNALTISKLKEFKTCFPPLSLQTEFANRVALIEQQKTNVKQALQKSEDLFNCLLQKSFKG